jgi:Zn-dependent membrane protease YugP
MLYILLTITFFVCIIGPGLWARYVLERYGREEYFSGTGIDLANLLVEDLRLTGVRVEATEAGDHYDPLEKTVRLNQETTGRRSLTAVVVAAHEIGHAMQDQSGGLLRFRTRLVQIGMCFERIGTGVLMALPLLGVVLRAPVIGRFFLVGAVIVLGLPVFIHFITLPIELDASFNRALPVLMAGRYIPPEDEVPARHILTACALTYLAQALVGMLNLARLIRIFRR